MKVSLFAASIRPYLWERFLESLKGNTVEYEVVFCGFVDENLAKEVSEKYPEFKYISTVDKETGNHIDIKPAQCYEIARRACSGDIIGWCSDDCEWSEKALDKIYNGLFNSKVILAIPNVDLECENNNLNEQRFYARNLNTPQMAVVGFMSSDYLDHLGGLDRRYIYGKWESDICMRVLADDGDVVRFEEVQVKIEHNMNKTGHLNNDWSGVNEDGETLENSWVIGGYQGLPKPLLIYGTPPVKYYPITNQEVTFTRFDEFEPYEAKDLLIRSQSLKGKWQ